jgi:hypothetical protein
MPLFHPSANSLHHSDTSFCLFLSSLNLMVCAQSIQQIYYSTADLSIFGEFCMEEKKFCAKKQRLGSRCLIFTE